MIRNLLSKSFKRKLIEVVQGVLLRRHLFLTSSMVHLERERVFNIKDRMDYVRLSCLELFAYEVQTENLVGDTAEVGVFQGEFAQKIQEAFPNRKIYLYDTFEGFDGRDKNFDLEKGFHAHDDDFTGTSVESVLSKMPNPSNCVVRKGRFPDTAQPTDGPFVFVNLDADLYLPTLAGLKFFYPRLCPGGLIFVHDFAGPGYAGIKQAVVEFCKENNLGYVSLCDTGGSIAIRKALIPPSP